MPSKEYCRRLREQNPNKYQEMLIKNKEREKERKLLKSKDLQKPALQRQQDQQKCLRKGCDMTKKECCVWKKECDKWKEEYAILKIECDRWRNRYKGVASESFRHQEILKELSTQVKEFISYTYQQTKDTLSSQGITVGPANRHLRDLQTLEKENGRLICKINKLTGLNLDIIENPNVAEDETTTTKGNYGKKSANMSVEDREESMVIHKIDTANATIFIKVEDKVVDTPIIHDAGTLNIAEDKLAGEVVKNDVQTADISDDEMSGTTHTNETLSNDVSDAALIETEEDEANVHHTADDIDDDCYKVDDQGNKDSKKKKKTTYEKYDESLIEQALDEIAAGAQTYEIAKFYNIDPRALTIYGCKRRRDSALKLKSLVTTQKLKENVCPVCGYEMLDYTKKAFLAHFSQHVFYDIVKSTVIFFCANIQTQSNECNNSEPLLEGAVNDKNMYGVEEESQTNFSRKERQPNNVCGEKSQLINVSEKCQPNPNEVCLTYKSNVHTSKQPEMLTADFIETYIQQRTVYRDRDEVDTLNEQRCVANNLGEEDSSNNQRNTLSNNNTLNNVHSNVLDNVAKANSQFKTDVVTSKDFDYTCSICQIKFLTQEMLLIHKNKTHKEQETGFSADSRTLYMRRDVAKANSQFKTDVVTSKDIDYTCNICQIKFLCWKMLLIHKKTTHKDQETRFSADRRTLNTKPDGERRVCEVCGRIVSGISKFKYHLQLHSDPSAFSCDICHDNLSSPQRLKVHKKLHLRYEKAIPEQSRQTVAVCDLCGRQFENKYTAKYHNCTYPRVKRNYKCVKCSLTFDKGSDYLKHSMIHKKFPCDVCGRMFLRKCNLSIHHYKIHVSKKPWECEICHATFTRSEFLERHFKKRHSDERPYPCKICGYGFKRNYDRLRHERRQSCHLKSSQQKSSVKLTIDEIQDGQKIISEQAQHTPSSASQNITNDSTNQIVIQPIQNIDMSTDQDIAKQITQDYLTFEAKPNISTLPMPATFQIII